MAFDLLDHFEAPTNIVLLGSRTLLTKFGGHRVFLVKLTFR